MIKNNSIFFVLGIFILFTMFIGASDVMAQEVVKTFTVSGSESTSECEMQDKGIVSNILNCTQTILRDVSGAFISNVVSKLGQVVMAGCTLAIMFMGIKIVFGMESFQKETATFMIKLLLVGAFSFNADLLIQWREYVVDTSAALGALVSDAAGGSAGCVSGDVFDNMDCLMMSILGVDETGNINFAHFAMGTSHSNPAAFFVVTIAVVLFFLLATKKDGSIDFLSPNSVPGWLLLLIGFMLSGIGILIVLLSVLLVFSLIMFMVQTVLLYITSIIAITFLIAITPLMLPLILFNYPKFRSMTEQWFRHILVYSLQPVFLVGFLALTIGIINEVALIMGDINEKTKEIASDQSKPNSYPAFTMPETPVDTESMSAKSDVAREAFEDMEAAGQSPTASSESSYDLLNSVDGTVKGVWKGIQDGVINTIGGSIKSPHLAAEPATIEEFVALNLALTILLWVIVSFVKHIPQMAEKMIGEGIYEPIVKTATETANIPNQAAVAGRKFTSKTAGAGVGQAVKQGAGVARKAVSDAFKKDEKPRDRTSNKTVNQKG